MGDGANLIIDGAMSGLGRLVPARAEWGVWLVRHQRAHSANYTVVMACIFASWRYILSTPSVVSYGEALGDLVAASSVYASCRPVGGPSSLA
jgi:hypothetical protein